MSDERWDVLEGDVLDRLGELPDGLVQVCVTSPPFYALRDYGDPGQIGLEATPEEYIAKLVAVFREVRRVLRADGTVWLNLGTTYARADGYPLKPTDAAWLAGLIDGEGCIQIHRQRRADSVDSFQIDLSVGMMTAEAVQHAYALTRLGSCQQQNRGVWDWSVRGQQTATLLRALYPYLVTKKRHAAYAIMLAEDLVAQKFGRGNPATAEAVAWRQAIKEAISALNQRQEPKLAMREPDPLPLAVKAKDDLLIPARAALALQADGWWVRSWIGWTKPNAMPESVTDRPTSAHETVLLLAKSGSYFYDPDGYREPFADERMGRDGSSLERERNRGGRSDGYTKPNGIDPSGNGGRNARNVWAIPTQPFPGAHFAVFPPELPRRAVLLGSSSRACRECGAPWQRLVDRERQFVGHSAQAGRSHDEINASGKWGPEELQGQDTLKSGPIVLTRTLGWRPSCACGAPDGVRPGDLDWIDSPTGDGENRAADPSLVVGRAGFARPRGEDEGTRPISRYEQREYARQLRRHPDRAELAAEAGEEAFAHYTRTDTIGARPVPGPLLEAWLERGVLARVEAPAPWWDEDDTGRCVVLDPFAGAGTTGLVAVNEGRDFVGVELNDEYAAMARRRIAEGTAQMRLALD